MTVTTDESAFAEQTEQYRHELQVHCYRMLGSFTDAEDHVQETLLRAWRRRDGFEGRSSLRAWLYRIATNACLDTLRRHPERVVPVGVGGEPAPTDVPWIQPYPDRLLDAASPVDDRPDTIAITRENIELAYLASIQLLPPNQRAALIIRDVLGWSAKETADLLDTSVAAANSALQRARATMAEHRPAPSDQWAPAADPTAEERTVLQRYIDAHHRADAAAVVELLREDVRCTMPPQPMSYVGLDALTELFGTVAFGEKALGEFRLVETSANRQPAAVNYIRRWDETEFRAETIDVLRIENGRITEITAFEGRLVGAFGLPEVL
ncbi:RNA polymerase subunit sigma-70 [Aldersonia sp. NBC_00410]|uniref:RNA polymerase subunit sigma-70 n=1 Tax=Aldersonia sp. NBC_00410 TaxID=2975954 RepID=UPI002258E8C2|nr:RNA polymerase subunit sigma-70 [Aldersonia sp. NBC_00410]MCX5046102.1 RNA polymerase subunit sigma-70 [Aldersonia sp. NBC_00410]